MKIDLNKYTLNIFNQVKIISLVGLLIFFDFSSAAQILTFYKIQNNTKTPVLPDEVVTFPLDENMSTYENLLIEVNLELLKQTTTYHTVSLAVGFLYDDTSFSDYSSIKLNFESEIFKTMYGDEKVLSVYFFKPISGSNNPKNKYFFDSSINFDHLHASRSWIFQLTGVYKTGTEIYHSNNIEKEKDVFSPPQQIQDSSRTVVQFSTTKTAELNKKYELYIHPYGMEMGELYGIKLIKNFLSIESAELRSTKENNPELGETSIYSTIAQAIDLIETTKRNAILNEPDKQKAIVLLEAWNKEFPYLQVLSRSSSANLLTLNDQLKGITDVNEMLNLFNNFNGR
jgi:hypothetical protein